MVSPNDLPGPEKKGVSCRSSSGPGLLLEIPLKLLVESILSVGLSTLKTAPHLTSQSSDCSSQSDGVLTRETSQVPRAFGPADHAAGASAERTGPWRRRFLAHHLVYMLGTGVKQVMNTSNTCVFFGVFRCFTEDFT